MFAHKKNHIHFIGICGVAMSALAILWKKKGWKVTGSDVGFYPPISTHLEKTISNFTPAGTPKKWAYQI
jgi:UDP-N-acetylmuramate: L-alanyl-gamma-D-glutamyl-meso-diaminopimelate ligase